MPDAGVDIESLRRENERLAAELAELRQQRSRELLGKQTLEEANRLLSKQLFHSRIVQEAAKVADAGEDLGACAEALFDVIGRMIDYRWIGLHFARDGHTSDYARPAAPAPEEVDAACSYTVLFRRSGQAFGRLALVAAAPLNEDERRILDTIAQQVSPILEHNLLIRLLQEFGTFREDFVHMLSHDLRNPLTGVISSLDTALTPGLPLPSSEREELFRTALASARMVNELIGDLLDVAKLEAGQLVLAVDPTDLGAIADQALYAFRGFATAKRLGLTLDAPDDLPLVAADERKVLRVFSNLIVNALKFTQHGGVLVRLRQRDGVVVATVADTGMGVPSDAQARLFEKFYQVRRDADSGTGLGLAFCRQMIEALGGHISLDSPSALAHAVFPTPDSADPGAAFHFTLPIALD